MSPPPARRGRGYSGPIIDVHTHPMLGPNPIFGNGPHAPRDYFRATQALDLRFAGALVMARRDDLEGTRKQNDRVLAIGSENGRRLYPVCSVHPADGPAALREVDRVARAGARGLKLHPNTQEFDVADPMVEALVRRATERRLPVLFDAYSPFDADQPGKFVRLAMAVPEARLILAHALGTRFAELLVYNVLNRYSWWKRNVWVDLSAMTTLMAEGPFREQYGWVLRKFGTDRLLFGSDYPLDDPRRAVRAVVSLGFAKEELAQVFYRNAAALFGLE